MSDLAQAEGAAMKPASPDSTPVQPKDAAERLWQLWQRGQRPDVDAFLTLAGPLSPADVAAVLRIDQRHRWQAGERILAETYLQRYPAVRADPESAVDLIFNEFLLRDRLGERPDPDEYLRRFPEHVAVLEPQIQLHRALAVAPASLSTPAPSAGPTAVSEDNVRPNPRPPVTLLFGGGVQSSEELSALLRKRLGFLAVLGVGSFILYAPIVLPLYMDVAWFSCTLVVTGVFGGVLWSRVPLSLRALRRIELILFGTQTLHSLWVSLGFFRDRWLDILAEHGGVAVAMASRNMSWFWVVLIILYGILIPNTWRRCAVVVSVLALCPVALYIVCGLLESAVEPRLLILFLCGILLDVGFASVIAVFGAHRLETLRQAASDARQLGQYQLKQRLGAGGMGEVYLAEHVLLRRPCALKLIRPELAGNPTTLRRFEREVKVMATLTHPNTVEIFDYGHAADGIFYYVMEYLPGLNLEELVARDGPLPPGRVVHLLRQVCGSLAEAHAAGLIHRDIKPANIIVCQRGGKHDVAKLLDFGLARGPEPGTDSARLTREGAIVGTPAYVSPEQAAGRALDARSDLYSLGAVAYFLLTGRMPFHRATAVQTLAAHLGDAVVPPSDLQPGLPTDVQAVVLQCLEKEPGWRFPDALALEQALAQCACSGQWS